MAKEAKARIKINKLLEDSGWRLLDSSDGKANVLFENNVKITKEGIDVLGENFEKTSNGFSPPPSSSTPSLISYCWMIEDSRWWFSKLNLTTKIHS